jgi:two-component system chemotaxis response regulator CheB
MVVDDSVVIRGMISRWIGAEPDMEVSAPAYRSRCRQPDRTHQADVAVLDIEMPELDGISAPPQLWRKSATSSSSWRRR